MLPFLLQRLHPSLTSSLPPYPPSFLPNLFISLPSSTFAAIVDSLLFHLTSRIDKLQPECPSESARRVAELFTLVIGSATVGGEALEAVTRSIQNMKGRTGDVQPQAIIRGSVCWVGTSDHNGKLLTGHGLETDSSCQVFLGNNGDYLDRSQANSIRILLTAVL